MEKDRPWILAACLILLAVAILAAAQWPAFPYFLDSYYHLSVIQGFRDSRGPSLTAFWEAAPEGRPHLYPPLFHLLWVPLSLLGFPPILMARLWSWAGLPLLLWVAWAVLSRLTTARAACLSLLSLASPYSFFLSAVNYLPATLVMAAGLGIFLALSQRRWLAGGILLGIAFWLHAGLPWLLVLSLILFSLFERSFKKTAWAILLTGLLLACPWLIHLGRNLSLMEFQPRGEERFLESPVLLLPLGVIGLKLAWQRRGIQRFLVALAIGFLPMAIGYRFRFFGAQGLFPWLLLAGVTLDWLSGKIRRKWPVVLGLAFLLFGAPTLHGSPQGIRLAWADTTLSLLAGRPPALARATAQPLFNEKFMGNLSKRMVAHTQPDELIWCNLPYLGGMLSVLSGRATTNQMLRELIERPPEAQIAPARLIVWVKDPSGQPSRPMQELALQYHLFPLGETEIAYLFENLHATGRREVRRAVVPWWMASVVIGLAVGILVWDLKRPS